MRHWTLSAAVRDACTELPAPLSVFGVDYSHLRLRDGSDLYVTDWGAPFTAQLLPENHWSDRQWFAAHSLRLPGTSVLYRATTRPVAGRSKEIVLKWNRMGQDIPGETQVSDLLGAEFNSPFEEFSLLMEMRRARGFSLRRLLTHKPLAVYVPRRFVEAEKLGRRRRLMDALRESHKEVTLDPNRQYAVIYEWIKGIDAGRALAEGTIAERTVLALLQRSNAELAERGFRVRDNKAHHIIVRPAPGGSLAVGPSGEPLYALVDFELLDRTPQHERAVRASRRRTYLVRQAHRFEAGTRPPPGLELVTILGVDYVYGHVESSGGSLWVVGDDPGLFDYFLPEKWRRTDRTNLSPANRTYETLTKDNIHLVWRVSRLGHRVAPDAGPAARASGYNSPFEEVALSLRLSRTGIDTTYPRAVYMSGHRPPTPDAQLDRSRYESHQDILTPEGHPVLSSNHDYMTLWGYWNGPDELLATRDRDYYSPIDLERACRDGLVGNTVARAVLAGVQRLLKGAGYQPFRLTGDHVLLSVDAAGSLVRDASGLPRARLCSFDLLRPLSHTLQFRPTRAGPLL
jgi:hypothetical protein